jgi:uncharacterized protein YeaO (DUF488 family)
VLRRAGSGATGRAASYTPNVLAARRAPARAVSRSDTFNDSPTPNLRDGDAIARRFGPHSSIMKSSQINITRAYDRPLGALGARFLVDRVWPRGVTKEELHLDGWLRDAAPSDALRRWFGHDPARWREFVSRYQAELDAHPAVVQPILDAVEKGPVTLLFGARDPEHNQAVVLRDYLLARLARH